MSDKSFDIKVNRRFHVGEYNSLKTGWLNDLDDFRQYVKDLPKLEKNIPWILFLEDSFCVKEIREKNTGQYIPHGRVLVGSGYGDATNIVDKSGFMTGTFPARIIVSRDGKVPTVAFLKKMNACGEVIECDKCPSSPWCYAVPPENQNVPAFYADGVSSRGYQPLLPNKRPSYDLLPNPGITSDIVINQNDCRLLYPDPKNKDNISEDGMPKGLVDFFKPVNPVNINIFIHDIRQKVKQ